MRVTFVDHAGFQRAALATVGVGAGVTLVAALAALPPWLALPGLVAALAVSIFRTGAASRARAERADPAVPFRSGPGVGRRTAAVVAAGGALVAARLTGEALVPGWFAAYATGIDDVVAGAVMGLVASAGLVPLHLEVRRPDPVAAALARIAARLPADERTLCERAAAAEGRIAAALAADRLPDARALRRQARAVTLEALALSEETGRDRDQDEVERTRKASALGALITSLSAEEAAAVDDASREPYRRALAALRDQQLQLAAIASAASRRRAHLHVQVALLEGTVLALAARRGAVAADATAGLAPLVERLRDVSLQAQAEAAALSDLDLARGA
jgi:hypothetical protein